MAYRKIGSMLACAALTAGLAAGVRAQQEPAVAGQVAVADAEMRELWFVELTGQPVAEGGSRAAVVAEQNAFRRAAASAGVGLQERYAFQTLFNGLSVRVVRGQVPGLARVAGVKAIYPVETVTAPPPPNPGAGASPDLATSIAMIGADLAQSDLGYTGLGVKVGVMDTGIDYHHGDLGGAGAPADDEVGFPNARVVLGWDFVGDAFNADSASPGYNPVPTPDQYPDDCNGHGTHVAGIIGANGEAKGVAPAVTFGAYRVFGCQGSTFADIMLLAMERALEDGMQVLNISIGSGFQWPEYPTAKAASRLVNKGVVVAASIGNNGTSGLYAAGAPGVGDKVIGVASYDNTMATMPAFSISPDNTLVGYNAATGAPAPPTVGSYPMAATGTPTTADDACAELQAGSLAGKVALIRRGACSFYIKAINAQLAGAAGVVLYNNVAGFVSPTVAPPTSADPPVTIPVVAIIRSDGELIDARIVAGPTDLTWTDQVTQVSNVSGGLISSFSSYGLTPDLLLKPDIGAPGGMIYSTVPLELGAYASYSGTSMASPHVAGAAALFLEAHPRTPSQAMGRIFQNTAVPASWWGIPGGPYLDMTSRQGAGMLQIDDAIRATTRIEPGKLSLGESEAGPVTRTLTVTNNGLSAVTYDLSLANALSVAKTFVPTAYMSNAAASFNPPSLTVAAGGTMTVEVTITPASGPDKGQYGGYIVLTPQGGGQEYRVPFAGFVGDYQSIPVLVPTANGFPWLARLSGGSYFKVDESGSYTMEDGDIPYFLLHLDHQSALLRMEVYEAGRGKAWHRAYEERYLPRNSTSTGFFVLPWDGVTAAGKKLYLLPNGTYTVTLSVLKALGDENNPAHWETWTSPEIVIQRPQ